MARAVRSTPDPRFRPYRVAVYAVYLTVVTTFALLVTVSVARSVLAMTPRRDPVRTATLDVPACVARAEGLYQELETHRRELTQIVPAARADAAWTDFRLGWLNRLRQSESSCGVAAPDRADLARVFSRLEHLEDLYTTSAVQYSGEIGPAVDGFRSALRSLGAGR